MQFEHFRSLIQLGSLHKTPRLRNQESPTTSTSLLRASAPVPTFVRGKSGYLPFQPGGLDHAYVDVNDLKKPVSKRPHGANISTAI